MNWLKLLLKKRLLKAYFNQLNWCEGEVYGMTSGCGSLDEAVEILVLEITDDKELFPYARKLVLNGFCKGWK